MANKLKIGKTELFKIRVKRRFFLSSSALFGDIFFEIEGDFFPGKNWNDFILIILDWWLNAILELIDKKKTELDFMDGPYEISIKLNNLGLCEMKLIERRWDDEVIIKTIVTSLEYLFNEIKSACDSLFKALANPKSVKLMKSSKEIENKNPKNLLKDIKENPSISEDYERLKKSYKRLSKQMKTNLFTNY